MTVQFGISAMSLAVPPNRVSLEDLAGWRGQSPGKLAAVIGTGFRLCDQRQNIYTLAADAVLKLILAENLDTRRLRYLALGTESSTDNAIGAVIVKGMVNDALKILGRPCLPRSVEVPEFKQACLGGIYALKNGLRALATGDPQDVAIAVAADIAEYEQGSTGEPTQGAGAVAMLLEANPKLLAINLAQSGTSSHYRGADFRKPFKRYLRQASDDHRVLDYPVFNGNYSTYCYTNSVVTALADLARRRQQPAYSMLDAYSAIFMHRPYHHMPRAALAACSVAAMAADDGQRDLLSSWCAELALNEDQLGGEIAGLLSTEQPKASADSQPALPVLDSLARHARTKAARQTRIEQQLAIGSEPMRELGNLYSAALPAWLGFGLEEAASDPSFDEGADILLMGYGSGDAAEALHCQLMPGWQEQAQRLNFDEALANAQTVSQHRYSALHAGQEDTDDPALSGCFVVAATGNETRADFTDLDLEYYAYIPS